MNNEKKYAAEWTSFALSVWFGDAGERPVREPNIEYLRELGAASIVAWALENSNSDQHENVTLKVYGLFNTVCNRRFLEVWHLSLIHI